MPPTILGLDVGGANLKAATPDKRAVSVPFASPFAFVPLRVPSPFAFRKVEREG